VIAKLEITAQGRNPRFIVTNLNGDAQRLYGKAYSARGDMENRIKEQPPSQEKVRPELLPGEVFILILRSLLQCCTKQWQFGEKRV